MSEKKIVFSTLTMALLASIVIKFYLIRYSNTSYPNYLHLEAINLHQHLIHSPKEKNNPLPTYFFIGTSSIAGSDFPPNTTLIDFFQELSPQIRSYNLASHQSNIYDIFTYFLLALKEKKPKKVILGINSDIFPVVSISKQVTYYHLSMTRKYFDQKTYDELSGDAWKTGYKIFHFVNPGGDYNIPHISILKLKEMINSLREYLYGKMLDKYIYGKYGKSLNHVYQDQVTMPLINKINEICKANDAELIVILEPEMAKNDPDMNIEFQRYENFVLEKLKELNIRTYNYTNILEGTEKHFVDFIHLTPEGYKAMALKLYNDLKRDGI